MTAAPFPPPVGVVVVLDSLRRPGGGETLAIESVLRLDPERYERTLCLTRWEDSFESAEPARTILAALRASGVRVVAVRRGSRLALWAWAPLIRILRERRTAVVHGHLFGSNLWSALLGRLCRVPVIVAHEHMWSYSGSRLRPLLDRFVIAPLTDAFVAVSAEGRRRMLEIERIPARDVVLIPNGVPALPRGDGAAVREQLGIPAATTLVGSVGHLRPEKAYEVLIAALPLLSDPAAALLIAGEGPERARLQELAADLGVADRVHLPGARSDVADVLDALDVAVCCSDFEGGPLSVMEYMGAGLPIVATDVGGLPELIVDGETGLLVRPRDPAGLAAAIDRLRSDRALAARLGDAARELRAREYDIGVWVGRLQRLYDELLARAAGRRTRRPRR